MAIACVTGVAAAAFLALITTPGAVMGDSSANEAQVAPRPALSEPSSAAKAVLPLHWKRVPRATYYNVIIWRDGERVLDYWPHRAVVRVPREKLQSGAYLWFVYPGFGSERARRFGELAKSGAFSL